MKMKKLTLAAIVAVLSGAAANAQTITADIISATSPSDPTIVNRFFQADGTTRAPLNTVIWFVADTAQNGLNLNSAGANTVFDVDFSNPSSILGGDNLFLAQVRVGSGIGTIPPGNQAGKINATATVSNTALVQGANIFALLFNQSDAGTLVPVAGDTFGIFNLGNPVEPVLGNVPYYVSGNISWNTYTVAAVPEPSTYAMMLLGGLGVLGYRRFKK